MTAIGNGIRERRWPEGLFGAVLVFGLLSLVVVAGIASPAEAALSALIQRLPVPPPWLQGPAGFVGGTEVDAAVVLAIALLFWRRRRRLAIAILAAFLAGNLIEVGLKFALAHPDAHVVANRLPPSDLPYGKAVRAVSDRLADALPRTTPAQSYPSGHMLRVVFVLTLLTALRPSRAASIAAILFAGGMAFALLSIGVHLASDVAGGALLGWACARAALVLGAPTQPSPPLSQG